MDIRKVKKLIEMLEDSSLEEIEIQEGEESVRLVKGSGSRQTIQPQSIVIPQETSSETNAESEPIQEKSKDSNSINSGLYLLLFPLIYFKNTLRLGINSL